MLTPLSRLFTYGCEGKEFDVLDEGLFVPLVPLIGLVEVFVDPWLLVVLIVEEFWGLIGVTDVVPFGSEVVVFLISQYWRNSSYVILTSASKSFYWDTSSFNVGQLFVLFKSLICFLRILWLATSWFLSSISLL